MTSDGGEVLGRIALGSVNLDECIAGVGYWVLPAARGTAANAPTPSAHPHCRGSGGSLSDLERVGDVELPVVDEPAH